MTELLDVALRWVHVIAGIMWIGNSLLFNWLDRNLRPPTSGAADAQGDIWLIHSGGFYLVEKTSLAGRPLPVPLHWFKWQAYTTWLSGAALLVVVYYAGGRALVADPAVAPIGHWTAVAVAVGAIVSGWLLYDTLWRTIAPKAPALAGVLSIVGLTSIVVALTSLLSGRAAFLHVGAMLGTIMAANVASVIMPSQDLLVAAVREGRLPDPAAAAAAKTRSIHNNYLTFPVIVLMVSSHFPSLYGHPWSGLILLVLIATGAAVRHVMNIRFTSRRWVPALAGTVATAAVVLYLLVAHGGGRAAATPVALIATDSATFAHVRTIIDRRCAACHSRQPSDLSFGVAPGGVAFDTPAEIAASAARIRERAVVTQTMPPGNRTRMTDRERALLARWVEEGAGVR
ncbi:MAG: urate hydroxylase PuuD [Gemmatimonadota bacterium]|nr:urate hydroxylase PuuD [Gemmatimonadota bacterium]